MSKIIPTVGRIVHFYTAKKPVMGGMEPRKGPFAAIITRVNDSGTVDLHVFDPGAYTDAWITGSYVAHRVRLVQEGDLPPLPHDPYCAWMPYQIGQAAKTEAARAPDLDRTTVAPSVTKTDIEANIASETYFTALDGVIHTYPEAIGVHDDITRALGLLTFCVLVMRNGFTVTGESACVSPENFDAVMGRNIARAKAIEKIWPLMGYALKERIIERAQDKQPATA